MTTPRPDQGPAATTAARSYASMAPRTRNPSPLPCGTAAAAATAAAGAVEEVGAEARLRAVHDRLTAAIADLTSAENWQLMLRTAAKLPTYSPHNVLLITSQCPQASAVAGFHTWRQLGRTVRKGEKGLAILAPVLRRPTERPSHGPSGVPAIGPASRGDSRGSSPGAGRTPSGSDASRSGMGGSDMTGSGAGSTAEQSGSGRRVVGFRVVHVFDIGQTDGPDLPAPPRPQLLAGQAPPGLLDGLTAQVQAQGYQLLRHDVDVPHPGMGVPNGVTDYLSRTVIVRPDLSDAQTTKTLAHELGHVLLHEPARRPADLTRQMAEVEAESVAHIVGAAHGLDTSAYTIPYVAGWSDGNLELLARSAERVIGTAHQILASTPPPPTFVLSDGSRTADRHRDTDRGPRREATHAATRDGLGGSSVGNPGGAPSASDQAASTAHARTASGARPRTDPRSAADAAGRAAERRSADAARQGRLW